MAQKKAAEPSAKLRRKSIEEDLAAYLTAGNKIEQVPSGMSSQDPQGRGKALRSGAPGTDNKSAPEQKKPTG